MPLDWNPWAMTIYNFHLSKNFLMHFLARYIAIWNFFSGGYILNDIYLDSSMITSNGVPC